MGNWTRWKSNQSSVSSSRSTISSTYLFDLIQRDRRIEPASPNVQVGKHFFVHGVPVGVRYSRQTIHRWYYHIFLLLLLSKPKLKTLHFYSLLFFSCADKAHGAIETCSACAASTLGGVLYPGILGDTLLIISPMKYSTRFWAPFSTGALAAVLFDSIFLRFYIFLFLSYIFFYGDRFTYSTLLCGRSRSIDQQGPAEDLKETKLILPLTIRLWHYF